MKLHNIAGWLGVAAILSAFALITSDIINSDHLLYILLNLFGSAGIIWSSAKNKDYQPAVLNIFWLFIALYGLIRLMTS